MHRMFGTQTLYLSLNMNLSLSINEDLKLIYRSPQVRLEFEFQYKIFLQGGVHANIEKNY